MNSWMERQTLGNIKQWEEVVNNDYHEESEKWMNPHENFRCINDVWGSLDAVKAIDWNHYIPKNSKVLDLGAGTGWLSAYLSTYSNVDTIYTVDSSRYLIKIMLPDIVKLMRGDIEKIIAINGIFTPILLDDDALDVVVMSSAIHHADNIAVVLNETNRVLKKGGLLFILNEHPTTDLKYPFKMIKQFIGIMKDTVLHTYKRSSPHISSTGCLHDQTLGDIDYPLWYMKKAIQDSNFKLIDHMVTKYHTYKNINKGPRFTHFICRKI
jgi:ubiquinone/menaquinone biosynthesis C-methylase UbiE